MSACPDPAASLIVGMMEFSLFGISYVSVLCMLLLPSKVSMSLRKQQELTLFLVVSDRGRHLWVLPRC